MVKDVTVIIRSAGERTTEYCKSILSLEVAESSVFVIKESPFSAAIKKSFDIGIREGRKWTLCIDADVLVRNNTVSHIIKFAENEGDNVFEIQGLILDKFFGIKRPAGNHLYRTSLIEKAIQYIPEEGSSLRPETDMLNRMVDKGFSWKQTDTLIGIHDFKQNYSDIYRKCHLQAHKHKHLIQKLESYWSQKKESDLDFQVALWGLRAGNVYNDTIFVDKGFVYEEACDVISLNGLKEKLPMSEVESDFSFVENIIQSHNAKNIVLSELQQHIFPPERWNITHVTTHKKTNIINIILLKSMLVFIGKLLESLGQKIQRVAEKI